MLPVISNQQGTSRCTRASRQQPQPQQGQQQQASSDINSSSLNHGECRLYADYTGPGDGRDTLAGGAGDDLLVSRDSLVDELFGGGGNDTCLADEDEDVLAGLEATM